MDVTRLLRYSREDLAKATCRKFLLVVVDPENENGMGRNNDRRAGLRFLIGSVLIGRNYRRSGTLLRLSLQRKEKKKGGKRDAVVLSSPFTPTNLHGGTTTAL